MRPKIVEYLNEQFGTSAFNWLVPDSSLIYALAMGVCLVVFVRRCRSVALSRYHALGAAIWAMVGGLVGARMFHIALHPGDVMAHPSLLLDVTGPTFSAGAYIGGCVGFWLYFLRREQEWSRYADVLASCLGLGPAIGRWSCFLNGDDFGTLSNLPWAVRFPHGSFPFAAQVQAGLIDPLTPESMPIHPVQLYLSLKGLLLFLIFTWIWKNIRLPAGVLFCLFWVSYAIMRFSLEYFRGDFDRGFIGLFSVPQLVCLAMFSGGAAGILYFWKREDSVRARDELESTQAN